MDVEVSVGLAFVAGLASFLAPCVLPLVPAYLGYLSGAALVTPGEHSSRERLAVLLHAVSFVLGFTLVFVLLGAAAGTLGALLKGDVLKIVGSLVMVFFGLALIGILKVPFLYQEAKLQWRGRREWGLLSSLLIGMVFAAGWTPCVGPALGAILALSANQSTAGRGILLLTAYSLGVGLPFILAALVIDRLSAALVRVQRYLPLIQKGVGALLVLAGVVLLTGSFAEIGRWLEQHHIGWDFGL
ncbi:MAG: sulfite exporter TauE/SafE family protein [Anaerolineae bacterium]|nr:sulfite exporter TauE/SafE family protein [Anaerolineae bacterium]